MSLPEQLFLGEMEAMGYDSKFRTTDSGLNWKSLEIDGIFVTIVFPKNILTDDAWKCKVSVLYYQYSTPFIFNTRYFVKIITEITSFKERCQSQY
jgi:hypothetical protein